jgi:threonine dehydrogenase-like Zn-dependent dehydrogenase
MGHEAIGEVLAIGAGVRSVEVGQRVILIPGGSCHSAADRKICPMCDRGLPLLCLNREDHVQGLTGGGGWSEQFIRHETQLLPLPSDISDEQAVLIEPIACAVHAVLRRPPQANDRVIVIGCGTIGLAIILALKALGIPLRVIAIGRHSYQLGQARSAGADAALLFGKEDLYERLASELRTDVKSRGKRNRLLNYGADIVYDAVGSGQTLQDALRWARPRGSVVVEGVTPCPSPSDCTNIWFREVDLAGSHGHGLENFENRKIHTFNLVINWIQERRLVCEGLITHRHRFPDYKNAVRAADGKSRSKATKVVLEMTP